MSRNPYQIERREAAKRNLPAIHRAETVDLTSAMAHFQAGRLGEAEQICRQRLAAEPGDAECLHLLGLIAYQAGQRDAAVELICRAILKKRDAANFHTNLGHILQAAGRLEDAVQCYAAAVALEPENAEAHAHLGFVLQALGYVEEAGVQYEHVLRLQPHRRDARLSLGLVQLLAGNFAEGLENYEFRSGLAEDRSFQQPRWRGEPLEGARILLHAEQGLGDTLHFLRYVPLVQAAGGRVVLEVQAGLRRLAAELVGGESGSESRRGAVVVQGEDLPEFEWQCPLTSLPLAFRTRLESVPAVVPYLTVPEEARRKAVALPWPARAQGLRVGLVWAGSSTHLKDRFRSVALEALAPLLDLVARRASDAGFWFFSLQLGGIGGQGQSFADGRVTDLTPAIGDMADTAALIEQLDLVIAVDTAVAHLAGALGKPVWVMLPTDPDWRWMLGREDSPWYPTMRLFRQARQGEWAPVIAAVRSALVAMGEARIVKTVGAEA